MPTFQKNLLMEAEGFSGTSMHIYHSTRHLIAEDSYRALFLISSIFLHIVGRMFVRTILKQPVVS
jgi:hypothetical protein